MLASCIILHIELLVLVGNIRSAELMSYFNFLPATSSLCLTPLPTSRPAQTGS